jgi:hypothetical protein
MERCFGNLWNWELLGIFFLSKIERNGLREIFFFVEMINVELKEKGCEIKTI